MYVVRFSVKINKMFNFGRIVGWLFVELVLGKLIIVCFLIVSFVFCFIYMYLCILIVEVLFKF